MVTLYPSEWLDQQTKAETAPTRYAAEPVLPVGHREEEPDPWEGELSLELSRRESTPPLLHELHDLPPPSAPEAPSADRAKPKVSYKCKILVALTVALLCSTLWILVQIHQPAIHRAANRLTQAATELHAVQHVGDSEMESPPDGHPLDRKFKGGRRADEDGLWKRSKAEPPLATSATGAVEGGFTEGTPTTHDSTTKPWDRTKFVPFDDRRRPQLARNDFWWLNFNKGMEESLRKKNEEFRRGVVGGTPASQ